MLFTDSDESKSCLSEECKEYCDQAYRIQKDLLNRVRDASVCVGDIEKIKNNRPFFLSLCKATRETLDDVEAMLDDICEEYTLFKKFQNTLISFCEELQGAKVVIEGKCILACIPAIGAEGYVIKGPEL